ncbi:hypothetical protein [Roseobacter weihaiensis]|uniref:hypothetical protein n=1 Tax=Roseobacter weihaiensis TaxID=2763262 RepID=UPI001D0B0DF8|nr:hypothetical protein [Roseobacter sp. H9]
MFLTNSLSKKRAKLLVLCCTVLAACTDAKEVSGSQSYLDTMAGKEFQLREGLALLEDACLRRPVTFDNAEELAHEKLIDYDEVRAGPTGGLRYKPYVPLLKVETVPRSLTYSQRAELPVSPKGTEYKQYLCEMSFRGTWADQMVGDVRALFADNSFDVVRPLERRDGVSRAGTAAVGYSGVYRRDGINFLVLVEHAGGDVQRSRNIETHYISGTRITLDGFRLE